MGEDERTQLAVVDLSSSNKNNIDGNQACLVQYNGKTIGMRFILDKEALSIGRSPSSDIVISDKSISRAHALIKKMGDDFYIEDLGSINGTYINQIKIEEKILLKDADMLQVGSVTFKFFARDNIDGFIQDKIYQMATIDPGTKIFNKRYLLEAIEAQFQLSRSLGSDLSIIYFDLDHFKRVNDVYGHNAGDQLLLEVAKRVKSFVRKDDIFARFGGEEFVILLPKTDLKTAGDLAERIRAGCEQIPYSLDLEKDGKKETISCIQTISLGVSQLNEKMEGSKALLENADQKLYYSKRNGRNRVTL